MENTDSRLQASYSKRFWLLDREITFLNHGSFGACPRHVLEVQAKVRSQLENEPVNFFNQQWEPLIDASREKLAAFVGSDVEDLVFVPNATTGVNSVLRSLSFQPGDELLTTNHEYNACRNALDFIANRTGAKVVVADIPFPIESSQQITTAILSRVSSKTRLALIDHITSQTGLIFPIQEIIQQLQARGIDTLIDGAHAPGMLPLDLRAIGATYYAGNCHKWLCAPKGAAFLYVQRQKQPEIRPLTISHGANSPLTHKSRFQLEFDWTGTSDPTPYICVGEVIQFLGLLLPGGWGELIQRNHDLVLEGRQIICDALKVKAPCPDEMIGSMAVIPMPKVLDSYTHTSLHDQLLDQHGIQVQVVPWEGMHRLLLRISAQLYNSLEDYQYLAEVLTNLEYSN
ncbi:aminotransferase class V-fold PLP-dependent enzyme [Calothrix sp. PCC 6303]|uniref:aminotransferase class V-fold PLP-dependent enzyme n=1 Tax=Calothrix sp. PCC 6303 TaxID=1170562 RepID=UPI0002A01341|nr:aminotransferase class V-fold PLP-dependent enzyme [Calothrix sp. PCC 6303]AFZ00580.1 Isopenicillin-N epimerase [Calothrix sp. PCC 6303]